MFIKKRLLRDLVKNRHQADKIPAAHFATDFMTNNKLWGKYELRDLKQIIHEWVDKGLISFPGKNAEDKYDTGSLGWHIHSKGIKQSSWFSWIFSLRGILISLTAVILFLIAVATWFGFTPDDLGTHYDKTLTEIKTWIN